MATRRKPGISVLIAAQNEESLVATCIRSFLEFGDELVVVDNGSTDSTKDIVRDLERQYPDRVRFHDVPELPDLHHNRQYALAHSSYRWICRADADFVAYTDGPDSILGLRDYLLRRPDYPWPCGVRAPLVNLCGDFWHAGKPMRNPGGFRANPERAYIPEPVNSGTVRLYRWVPGFRFQRVGRWEGVRFNRCYRLNAIRWPRPLWMHCNIKSDMNHFYRSERTNWRELGDFQRFPTLQSYIESVVEQKYGTRDLAEAARIYMERHVLPYLEPYDPDQHYPYPALVREQMQENPVYRIRTLDGRLTREYYGMKPPSVRSPAETRR